ncbi:metallophosphoesterase family protein [Miniphocaeibacter halophilus]|uniref:Metallophosphoesterase n=1 Tax=Miniphocaeibacter halophilus TaxID=2931922 RepID=A0AC61MUG2_9FIRM|nr:metallophosphoesterase [Miniphocaeibacter halophilus]QQK07736.1 metallophosphoesterase [Miniphocaeibacter halophilus]
MKVAIISDTHGSFDNVIEEIEKHNIDLIIHLGDFSDDGRDIGLITNKISYVVKGNNDYLANNELEDLFINLNGIDFFITHGHRYNVYRGVGNLVKRAKKANAKIALYGHTHVYFNEVVDGVWVINPGSPSYPRYGDDKSFVILDLDTMELERIKFRRSKWKLY